MKLDVSTFHEFILPIKPYICMIVILQESEWMTSLSDVSLLLYLSLKIYDADRNKSVF